MNGFRQQRFCCGRASSARPQPLVLLLLVLVAACTSTRQPSAPSTTDSSPVAPLILVSSNATAYQRVAERVAARMAPAPRVYQLDASPVPKGTREAGRGPIVAIGPQALHQALALPGRPVVFTQVYNYEEFDVRGSVRGVKATPPVAKQFQAWKLLDPRVRRVALVSGPRLKALQAEARSAARTEGWEVEVIEVQSDKELVYAVKRLGPEVQGVWLAPDHRILTEPALREVLAHSLRQGRSVLSFSPELLAFGALLSAEGEYDEIAERVLAQLQSLARREGGVPKVVPLTRARVEVNDLVARQLGLTVPGSLQGGQHVF